MNVKKEREILDEVMDLNQESKFAVEYFWDGYIGVKEIKNEDGTEVSKVMLLSSITEELSKMMRYEMIIQKSLDKLNSATSVSGN